MLDIHGPGTGARGHKKRMMDQLSHQPVLCVCDRGSARLWPFYFAGRPFLTCSLNCGGRRGGRDAADEDMCFSYAISAFMDNTIAAPPRPRRTIVPTMVVIMGSCVFPRDLGIYHLRALSHDPLGFYLLYALSSGRDHGGGRDRLFPALLPSSDSCRIRRDRLRELPNCAILSAETGKGELCLQITKRDLRVAEAQRSQKRKNHDQRHR